MPASSRSKTRQRNERRGRWAEGLAVLALRLKGYRLLARRFKSGPGEVDLIMRRGDVTAFIEVKVRSTVDLAIEAVTDFQTRRIAAAARLWMAKDRKAALGICRFDIVAVSPYQWPKHIPNAFTVED
jgi:putative endonuclease